MPYRLFLLIVLSALLTPPALAQATQPAAAPQSATLASQDLAMLEMQANRAFTAGDYRTALPLLARLAEAVQGDSGKLALVQEKIRVSIRNLPVGEAYNLVEKPPTLETRTPHAPPAPGEVRELAIKDLGNFPYDDQTGSVIPDDVKALGGSTVRVRGYMLPLDQSDRITTFALVPSLFACCFGAPPSVQHTIIVRTPPGKAVSYYPEPIVIEGKLTVDEKKDEGYTVSIFEVDVTSVKPAPQ